MYKKCDAHAVVVLAVQPITFLFYSCHRHIGIFNSLWNLKLPRIKQRSFVLSAADLWNRLLQDWKTALSWRLKYIVIKKPSTIPYLVTLQIQTYESLYFVWLLCLLFSYLSNISTNLCIALLSYSLFCFIRFFIVMLLYSILMWRQGYP